MNMILECEHQSGSKQANTLVTLHCIGQLASVWYLGYASILPWPSQELNFETERVSFFIS